MTTTLDSDAPAADAPPPPRRRRTWLRVLIIIGIVVVLLLAAVGVYAAVLNNRITSNIHHGTGLLPTDPTASSGPAPTPRPTKDALETGTLNYVLLGSDSRNPDNAEDDARSDSIMIVHLNKARTKAYIVSFPRDMYVNIPGHGKDKINAAFSEGGAALTVRTLESLTNTRMDHVVLVDFEGFIQLTDDLGGVEVTNKTAFTSHGYTYPKGKINVKGQEALWFVRERHSLPNGDLDRAENQRNVIKAVVQKGLSPQLLSDPAKFTTFISGLAQHLTVDDSLSDSEIRSTAFSLRLTGKDIELLQAPISGFGTTNGQSIDVVDEAKLAELATALKKDRMGDYVKKYPQG